MNQRKNSLLDLAKGAQRRKGFDAAGNALCKGCFERDRIIEELREKLNRANAKIAFYEKKKVVRKEIENEPHMPSSRKNFKKNSTEEQRMKKGGAKKGHKGHARISLKKANDFDELLEMPNHCPDCKEALSQKDIQSKTVVEVKTIKAKKFVQGIKRGQCPKCRKIHKKHNTLPKSMYGNRLISQAAILHYFHGIPISRLPKILGEEVKKAALINTFHRLGKLFSPARNWLIDEFRNSYTRHADETGWRNDGFSGYAWIFSSKKVTILEFRDSRSSSIPKEIIGTKALDGYLVVDRYPGYNQSPVKIQYCWAHLLREIKKMKTEFPDSQEVFEFQKRAGKLMSAAMNLQTLPLTNIQYLQAAEDIRKKFTSELNLPYKHLAIRRFQNIFEKNKSKMYWWSNDPEVPPDNNFAEREIRSVVVSRKTSFGSQSNKGAQTRSAIMSVLFTANKRLKKVGLEDWLYESLNEIASNPKKEIVDLIPP